MRCLGKEHTPCHCRDLCSRDRLENQATRLGVRGQAFASAGTQLDARGAKGDWTCYAIPDLKSCQSKDAAVTGPNQVGWLPAIRNYSFLLRSFIAGPEEVP